MSDYPKVIERPYKVFVGEAEYEEVSHLDESNDYRTVTGVNWSYSRSFRLESDAEAYTERMSEDYEFVKIEKKENN